MYQFTHLLLLLSSSTSLLRCVRAVSSGSSTRTSGTSTSSTRIHHHNRRRLDQEEEVDMEVALDLAKYSIKFDSCQQGDRESNEDVDSLRQRLGRRKLEDPGWDVDVNNDEEDIYGHPIMRSSVTFRFCDTTAPTSCADSCIDSKHGELVVDMVTYLYAVREYKYQVQEEYCEACWDCLNQELLVEEEEFLTENKCDSIDTSECYNECQKIENMEENGYLEAAEFIECQQLNGFGNDDDGNVYYAGPMCDNSRDSSRIKIGVFLDWQCLILDDTKNVEDYLLDEDGYQMSLSYSLLRQAYAEEECVAPCLRENNEVTNQRQQSEPVFPEITGVCEELYYAEFASPHEYTPAPTPAPTNATCVYKNPTGIYFAGKYCEFEATSVCNSAESDDDENEAPDHFCTNGGRCSYLTDGDCLCPSGFHGRYCELVQDEEEEEDGHENHEDSWGDGDEDEGEDNFDDDIFNPLWSNDDGEVDYDEMPNNMWILDAIDDSIDDAFDQTQLGVLNYTVREYYALMGFYKLTSGDNWLRNDFWLSNEVGVCDWYGVGCNEGRSVVSLELSQNNVVGSFDDVGSLFLEKLANLTMLDLEDNGLSGSIAQEFSAKLPNLMHLRLGRNTLHGTVPTSLARLSRLESLELQENEFSYIDIAMSRGYENLRNLDLSSNQFTGTIPYWIIWLSELEHVSLRNNGLVGRLAGDYSSLTNLIKFDVSSNMISGSLEAIEAPGFAKSVKLQYLNISHNNIGGVIDWRVVNSQFVSSDESPYFELDLSHNRLEGTLPDFGLDMLNINVVGNALGDIDPMVCEHDEWNNGAILNFGCDGIACAPGTTNVEGRQTSEDGPCKSCPTAHFYGTVGCNEGAHEEEGDDHEDFGGGDAVYIPPDNETSGEYIPAGDIIYDEAVGEAVGDNDCRFACLNGGVCARGSSSFGSCICLPAYAGEQCESIYEPMTPSLSPSSSQLPSPPPIAQSLPVVTPVNDATFISNTALSEPSSKPSSEPSTQTTAAPSIAATTPEPTTIAPDPFISGTIIVVPRLQILLTLLPLVFYV